ncbi:MAG: hypothetical protein WD795_00600 [Woeseia sp.]
MRLSSREWLPHLAGLGPDDLRRISRLVDLLVVADPATKETALTMLDARPEAETAQEARDRADGVIEYLQAGGAA